MQTHFGYRISARTGSVATANFKCSKVHISILVCPNSSIALGSRGPPRRRIQGSIRHSRVTAAASVELAGSSLPPA